MSIPTRLSHYLDQHGARYAVYAHRHSHSSAETARLANVRLHQLAKPVLLEDERGVVLAVVPADKVVRLAAIAQLLCRRRLHLSDEERIMKLFGDCERGAVPPLGMPWGIQTIVDSELEDNEVVYLECGDHESLLRLSNLQFCELMRDAQHGRFSRARLH